MSNVHISNIILDPNKGSLSYKSTSILILSACLNFIALSMIFVTTLYFRWKTMNQPSYLRNAFIYGILYSLIAAITIFIIDIISGSFASLIMIPVYVLSGLSMLVLSLIAPTFIADASNGDKVYISAYRLWSISFWPIFIIGMLIALILGLFVSYLSTRFSKFLMDTISRFTIDGKLENIDISSLLSYIRMH